MSTVTENKPNLSLELPSLAFQNMIYCFHITLQNETDLYLTEFDQSIIVDNMIFTPNSGLSFKEGEFNDSAQNYIILEGIFEEGGIDQKMDLTGAKVKILIYINSNFNNRLSQDDPKLRFVQAQSVYYSRTTLELQGETLYHFVSYYCALYTQQDLHFRIRLEPTITAYNQSLLLSFSKTCRANFGDTKCKINKLSYSESYQIKEMFGKTLIILNLDKEDGYFNCGEAIFADNQFQATIVSQFNSSIILDKVIPDNIKHYPNVTLIVGCDKDFTTCCNKFDNGVNFRGEPLIPDHNHIKVSL